MPGAGVKLPPEQHPSPTQLIFKFYVGIVNSAKLLKAQFAIWANFTGVQIIFLTIFNVCQFLPELIFPS